MKKLLTVGLMSVLALTAVAKNIKTAVFTTKPEMHCTSCEKKIKENIRFEKGVKRIETRLNEQQIVIQYDADKTTPENIIKGFKRIKYDAKVVETGPKQAEKK